MTRITIVSGFLGAGKTTFIGKILKYYQSQGEMPFYLVNEFGNTGLDGELISADGFQTFELEGGCVCCSLKGNFIAALNLILERYNPSHIIFEPSGIFVFDNFMELLEEETLRQKCTIGSVITIVDGKNFNKYQPVAGSFLHNQIKNASFLVVSKLDHGEKLENQLRQINPEAFILTKNWDSLSSEDFEVRLAGQPKELPASEKTKHPRLESVTLEVPQIVTKLQLFNLRKKVKSGVFGEMLRIKGFIKTESGAALFNMSLDSMTVTPREETDFYRLTFIGKNLKTQEIKKLFLK